MRKLITALYYIIIGVLIIRVIASWIPALGASVIGEIVSTITDPVMKPLGKILTFGDFDLSAFVLIIGLGYLYRWLMTKVR
ncbi:MAG: YggT family protein [Verrucomicrobiota bacterium]